MECLHGKPACSYNQFSLLEGIYANAVAHEVHRLCEEFRCGCKINHPGQIQHNGLMIDKYERWQMYGSQAIQQVYAKRMVWNKLLKSEATRVLKLQVYADVLEHLRGNGKRSRYNICLFVDGTTPKY